MMSDVVIKFNNLKQSYINKILAEKFGYRVSLFELGSEIFCFEGRDFMRRFGESSPLEREAQRFAFEIGNYDFVSNVRFSYDRDSDRYRIVVIGRESLDPFVGGFSGDRSFGGSIVGSFDPDHLRKYFENDRKAVLDAYKRDTTHLRIPKTFDVYSGYSKDGRLRTVAHWQDGEKTSVYLSNEDDDSFGHDLYLAIAYCYVKRKFGTMSHFKRIVERNTKDVTGGVKRFIYGGDSTLLVNVMLYSIYDQVALYLATSYLGDTDQWLTEEDIKRLEDSINE